MSLKRNFVAGLANSIWSALIGLAVVPLYLKYLGIEAYGLICFFATTQVLRQLLDMCLAPTINRGVAQYSASFLLALSVSLGLVGHYATQAEGHSAYVKLIFGGTLTLIAFSLSLSVSPRLRGRSVVTGLGCKKNLTLL